MNETNNEQNGKRRGPPKGSKNAMRHGLRAGQLPDDCKYVENRLNQFRRNLETAVMKLRREVTIEDAANIQTCLRWERHACLAQRWLNKAYDELKPVERLTFSREIARASTERDRALKELCVDKAVDPWSEIDGLTITSPTGGDNGDSDNGE